MCLIEIVTHLWHSLLKWKLILALVYFSHIHVHIYIYVWLINTITYIYYYSHCEGHGQCNCGRCDCKVGWYGKKCEHPRSCPLSAEESIKKCQGSSALPCSGRGKWGSQALWPIASCESNEFSSHVSYLKGSWDSWMRKD